MGEYHNLQFRIAKSKEELEAVFRLRFLGYTKTIDLIDPAFFPDQMERDQFDDIAINFLAQELDSANYVGCVRLVPDTPMGLPLEEAASLAHFRSPEKKLMEHSRMVSWPPGQPEVNFGLLAITAQYSAREGVTHWVGMGMTHMKPYYESRGFYQIEPYQEFTLRRKDGYLLNKKYFLTTFDFEKIFGAESDRMQLPFKPDPQVFRILEPDPRLIIE